MKNNLNWFIFGALVSLIFLLMISKCEKPYKQEFKGIDSLKVRIDTVKVEVVKLKGVKSKIIYRTKFDTLATTDTVYAELKKCDTIVKIDSIIIQRQDTIIKGQEGIISDQDSNIQVLESEVKKTKRKLLFTKIIAGAIILITIFITK